MVGYVATSGVFLRAFADSDFFGKWIFFSLFALSLFCWFLIMQKAWIFFNVKKISGQFRALILEQKKNLLQLNDETLPSVVRKEIPHPFAKIFFAVKRKAIELLDKNRYFQSEVFLSHGDMEYVDAHLKSAITAEVKRLDKNLFLLATTVSLAPFLGILGTVWGILISLGEMQNGSGHSNAIVLSGLSTALATTVLGLVIAIPALIAYNYFKNAIRSLSSDMHDFGNVLLSTVELQYRRVDS